MVGGPVTGTAKLALMMVSINLGVCSVVTGFPRPHSVLAAVGLGASGF